jgi:hypothetical protein
MPPFRLSVGFDEQLIFMRLVVALLIVSHGAFAQTHRVSDKDFGKLSWLEGTWIRTNAKPGRSGTEVWVRENAKELIGRGVSMKGNDTSFVEKLKIVIKNGSIYYVSDVPENPKPVDFIITAIDDDGFVCENPLHDYPKKIVYRRTGDKLRAVTSGDGKEAEFLFERKLN